MKANWKGGTMMGIKKSKWILTAVLFVAGIFINVYLSGIIIKLVENKIQSLADIKVISYSMCVSSLTTNDNQLTLFLCLQGLIIVCLLILLMNKKTSQFESPMVSITPNIKTPVAAGQKQHGSAEWLKKNEYKTAFGSYLLDHGDPEIRELIKSGYDDLDFMKKKGGSDNDIVGSKNPKRTEVDNEND